MNALLGWSAAAVFGLAGGIAVGSGMVAFLLVLDIIPRLLQISRAVNRIRSCEAAVITGSLTFTVLDFMDWHLSAPLWWTGFFGLFAGAFVGMLSAALTEIINVLPVLAKRVGVASHMVWLLMAMILGKVLGSLFEWFIY
ncbi:stage V sporulation protein AB [Paenibacillus lutrae]|uniref:Stage V sporulation protein AB n=1 Tax=Paenibacillus lutrae TaxID=2078573 RepID=A0A7X3JZE5_9BACL|nr:stage V sporulation protein AB [Paenibacillus lutrae]MVP00099.1 stage V sporulation protein AB [Paenibacillus lutrae]